MVLDKRAERVERLHIRPLAPGDRARFVESWGRVEARFVDGPGGAVTDADQLLGDVMSTRGYPVSDFEQRVADISTDHPLVLDNYRAAHHTAVRQTRGLASTEDLRQAMIHYRTLFEELIGEPAVASPYKRLTCQAGLRLCSNGLKYAANRGMCSFPYRRTGCWRLILRLGSDGEFVRT